MTTSATTGVWQCRELAILFMGPCPPAIKGTTCKAGSVVEEGQTVCCGLILPVWVCRCGSAGTYECALENSPWMMCMCDDPTEGGNDTILILILFPSLAFSTTNNLLASNYTEMFVKVGCANDLKLSITVADGQYSIRDSNSFP
jgi:hypothetical protein